MRKIRMAAMQAPAARLYRSAMIVLICAVAGTQPARAQDTGTSEAGAKETGARETGARETGARETGARETAGKGTLNFVDADIESVIAAIGDYTKTTFIVDPRVKGKINLVSEKPLTKAQAFQLLTSVLRLHGYAVVAGSGYTKVVPEADAKLQSGPTQTGAVRGDQIATQVFRLNYESAANLVPVLRPLIAPNNTINANPSNNTLVITDYADNLLRLGKIISALDSPANAELEVVPIRYAVASDVANMVNRLLDSGGQPGGQPPGGDGGRVTLLAETRSNSVIIRAPSEARAQLAKSLIAKLDVPTANPGNVHVVYLRNAEATKLAQTLRAVVSSETSAISQPPGSPQPSAAQQPLPSGGPAGFIQADAATNTLIITASETVYRNLRSIIDQLDARRAQVYIESLIVEVSATRAAEFGIQWAALSGNNASKYRVGGVTGFSGAAAGDNLLNQAAAFAAGSVPPQPGNGLSVGIFRQDPATGQIGLGALARALASDADANILSMPNLVTLDNEEAKIIVGQNVPFITGQYTTAASGGSANVNPFQTVERKDIGLSLRVKPQISEGGTVKMAIYQETSGIDNTVATGGAGLATTKRSIDTNVLVDDGQIIVLGGLIDDKENDSVTKVPLLGDIPIIGNLFKYQNRSRAKTNLMVFLRPTVIRNNEQSVSLSSDRYDYIRNAEAEAQPETKLTMPNYGAPLLPPLQESRKARQGTPTQTTPNQISPSQTAPGQTAPTQTAPTAPAQPLPGQTTPNQAEPGLSPPPPEPPSQVAPAQRPTTAPNE